MLKTELIREIIRLSPDYPFNSLKKLKKNVNKIIKEIPKTTYKNLFKGSYERNSKYLPKKSRLKPLKHYK